MMEIPKFDRSALVSVETTSSKRRISDTDSDGFPDGNICCNEQEIIAKGNPGFICLAHLIQGMNGKRYQPCSSRKKCPDFTQVQTQQPELITAIRYNLLLTQNS